MNPKITLLLALAMCAISAASAQHGHGYGGSSVHGPANFRKSAKSISVGSQSAANEYSEKSSNTNRGYNMNSKVDIDENQVAQKEARPAPPPPPPAVVEKPVYVPVEPKYEPAPKY